MECVFICISVISFNNVLYVLLYKSFTFLVKSISKYFILFDATVNGIAFMIFFSDYSLHIEMQLILFIDLVFRYFAEFISSTRFFFCNESIFLAIITS